MFRGFYIAPVVVWLLLGAVVFACWNWTTETSQVNVLLNTLLLGVASFAVAVFPATWIAWRIRYTSSRFERQAAGLILGMLFVPLVLQVAAWESVFGKLSWITYLNNRVFMGVVEGWPAAIWIHACAGVPWIVLILLIGVSHKSKNFEEQALLDADPRTVFWRVTIARMIPLFLTAFLWTVVTVGREIAVADIYQVGTYAEQVYLGYSLSQFDINPAGSADVIEFLGPASQFSLIGWMLMSVLFVLVRLTRVREQDASSASEIQRNRGFVPGLVTTAIVIFVVALPMFGLASRAGFQVNRLSTGPEASFSLSHLVGTMGRVPSAYRDEIVWSSLIGLCAATFVVLFSVPMAWSIVFGKRWIRWSVLVLPAGLSLSIPYPMVAIAFDRICNSIEASWFTAIYDRSILFPSMAGFIIGFGLCLLILVYRLQRISKSTLESSEMEGATGMVRFWRIGIQSNWRSILVCAIVAFLVSVGDVAAVFLVLPPGMDTISRRILGQLHSGVDDMTAAVGLIGFALSIGMTYLAGKLWRGN